MVPALIPFCMCRVSVIAVMRYGNSSALFWRKSRYAGVPMERTALPYKSVIVAPQSHRQRAKA